jgi:hypothetical protein
MTTLMQAVARAREYDQFPPDGDVRMTQLQGHYQKPADRGSMRSLIAAMRARAAVVRPYAVILCRFKGDSPHPDEERWSRFFRAAFSPGTGGFVEYWQDVSLGRVDVNGTRVFGWVDVDMPRAAAGYPPTRRGDLTAAAIRAVQAQKAPDNDPITGFYNQISLYMYRKTADGRPIDGSTDGNTNRTNLTAPFDGIVTAHEMGHSLGMEHDADISGSTDYHDPCCIMSKYGGFVPDRWDVVFGPAVCLPHLLLQGWMYNRRVLYNDGDWAQGPGIDLTLAPNNEPASHAHLGASLANPEAKPKWAYLLELVAPTGWNQGIVGTPYLMIRRTTADSDLRPKWTSMYLGKLHVDPSGTKSVFSEASGNTMFTVSLTDRRGPLVTVHAQKLIG